MTTFWDQEGIRVRAVLLGLVLLVGVLFTVAASTPAVALNEAATSVSAGNGHSCAVLDDGRVQCWGANAKGQLGIGTNTNSSTPQTVPGIATASAISAGSGHTCAVLSSGQVQCWGSNIVGELGNGTGTDSSLPVVAIGITSAISVSAGSSHTCALLSAGEVRCWGSNFNGRLGDGTTASSSTPVAVLGINSGVSLSVGAGHSCAVLSDGGIRCWGNNATGQLGDGSTTSNSSPVSVAVIATAQSVSAGDSHTCAVLADETARCWGKNTNGQLGNATTTDSPVPVAAFGLVSAISVAAGAKHTCATISDGQISCWGSNANGEFGDGSFGSANETSPRTLDRFLDAVQNSVGATHSCLVLTSGLVLCAGDNFAGQLGNGMTTDSMVPVIAIWGPTKPVSEVAAATEYSCAVLRSGQIECWGDGIVDIGLSASRLPVQVNSIASAVSVSVSDTHACAVLANGGTECWGQNLFGQLGDGTDFPRLDPVSVSGVTTAIEVSVGPGVSCVLLVSGSVECWGSNSEGQLGNGGSPFSNSPDPVLVAGITTGTSISGGERSFCTVLASGSVRCWGSNHSGQLGNGTTSDSSTPSTVIGITNAMSVSAGEDHACAVLASGSVRCWGSNEFGQLGDGTTMDSLTPSSVVGLTTAVSVSAGSGFSCATLDSGSVRCWGIGGVGQLGNGFSANSSVPLVVDGITNASSSVGKGNHQCVVLPTGDVRCWGHSFFNQLGIRGSLGVRVDSVVGFGPAQITGITNIDPCVLWDSAAANAQFGGPMDGGQAVTIQTTGALSNQGGSSNCGIPPSTTGVVVNITASSPQRAGNLRAYPAGQPATGGVVTFSPQSPNLNNSNAVIVPVSASGQLTLETNAGPTGVGLPTTDIEVIAIGYLDSSGDLYTAVTPCAFADSRSGTGVHAGPYDGNETHTVQLFGTFPAEQGGGQTDCNIPGSANSALVNLVAVNPVGSGEIGMRPANLSNQTTYAGYSQLNPAMNNSNAVFVPLSASGELDLFAVAGASSSVHVRAVVLGYLSPSGDSYIPITPCAGFDSRVVQAATGSQAGPYVGGEIRTFQIAGSFPAGQGGGNTNCLIPQNASSVLINVVAVNPLREGNLKASASGTAPTGGILNFATLSPSLNNSNAVVVPLANGQIDIAANGGPTGVNQPLTEVRGVILGYFLPG